MLQKPELDFEGYKISQSNSFSAISPIINIYFV
jgi:hypothetical protein